MKKTFLIFFLFLTSFSLFAEENLENKNVKTDIGFIDAIILGLVEGITEFLPISSTGHLILADNLLGLDSDTPLKNSQGEFIIDARASRKSGETVFFTMKKAADSYAVIIQIGAIAAVALIYWRTLLEMAFGFLGKSRKGLLIARNLILAFLPAAIFGFLFHDLIEKFLFGIYPVVFALFAGAFLMFYAQKKYKKFQDEKLDLEELNVKQSVLIGLCQCVALWPGTSRSMMAILGGYAVGLSPVKSAKFSFLLGFITLSAASFYKMLKDGSTMIQAISIAPLLLGLVVAFISAAISVKWLVGFLTTHGLNPFAWYRIALCLVILLLNV